MLPASATCRHSHMTCPLPHQLAVAPLLVLVVLAPQALPFQSMPPCMLVPLVLVVLVLVLVETAAAALQLAQELAVPELVQGAPEQARRHLLLVVVEGAAVVVAPTRQEAMASLLDRLHLSPSRLALEGALGGALH